MNKFKINEIFQSIQGEGIMVGKPMNFIRFCKCNLSCKWCTGYREGRRVPRIISSNGRNKKIFDVNVGDRLLAIGENGALVETTVKKVFTREVLEFYEIKIEGKPLLYFTEEHPFYINGKWTSVSDLKIGDEVFHITPNEKIKFFARKYNPMFRGEVVKKRLKHVDYENIGRKISKTRKKLFKSGKLKPLITTLKEKDFERYKQLTEMSSERMKVDNPMKNPNVVEKVIKMNRLRGHYKKFSERMKIKNPTKSIRFREYITKNNPMKRNEVVMKNWISHQKRPSSIEKKVKTIAEEYCLPILYVGNSKFWVNGKNPDFIVNPIDETTKVIEVFDPTYLDRSEEWINNRIAHFESNGYKCLILSIMYKTKDEDILIKLRNFISNGLKIERIRKFEPNKRYNYFNPKPLKVYNFHCEPYNNYFVDYLLVHNCDTNFREGVEMRIEEILEELNERLEWISLTGGEPLLEKNLSFLIQRLKEKNFKILLETNGTKFDKNIFNECDFISVDLKPPSSRNEGYNEDVFSYCLKNPEKTQMKIVIQNEEDLNFFKRIYSVGYENWILQPEWSVTKELNYEKIIDLFPKVRIIPQIHKLMGVR